MSTRRSLIGMVIQLIVGFILVLLYILNYSGFVVGGDHFLIIILLGAFLLAYFSSWYIGMDALHPYRIYLIVFFLYNCGGYVDSLFSGEDFFKIPFGSVSSDVYIEFVRTETLFSIIFFLVFFHLGVCFYASSVDRGVTVFEAHRQAGGQSIEMRKFGLLVFVLFLVPAYYYYFYVVSEAILLGGYVGYVQADKIGTTDLPLLVRISDDLFIFGYWMYLASLPSERKLKLLLTLLYIFPFIMVTIATGSRFHAISQILALVTYFSLIKALRLRQVIIVLGVAVVFSVFLGELRSTKDYDVDHALEQSGDGYLNQLRSFVLAQGVSSLTIGLTVVSVESSKLEHSPAFLLAPFIGSTGYDSSKTSGDYYNLADRLSSMYHDKFHLGSGLGSSIVAEFYAAAGIIGVIVFAFLYAIVFLFIFSKAKSSDGWFLFFLLILPSFYYTARAHPLTPISSLGGVTITLLIAYASTRCFRARSKDSLKSP